jgi:DNA mismatch repair protein MutL
MTIKRLSETTINRIAAGEVLERPASAIKELVENSIDAGATKIEVRIARGGKNLISVKDNGCGMYKEDIWLSLDRHTTSKLNEEDITHIVNFGFRGEALPSIASVSRMKIESKKQSQETGYSLTCTGGEREDFEVSAINEGTKIEVRDLFFATPARLKFLKTDKTEANNCSDILKKIALVHPHISISLDIDDKRAFKYRAHDKHDKSILQKMRLQEVLGEKFVENSTRLYYESEQIVVSGYVGLPTFNKATSNEQYLFVNDRPVRDKLLLAATKVAYADFLAKDRHPVVVIDVKLNPEILDVNVHPTKSEVRFNEPSLVRNILVRAIKEAIQNSSHKAASTGAEEAINAARPASGDSSFFHSGPSYYGDQAWAHGASTNSSLGANSMGENQQASFVVDSTDNSGRDDNSSIAHAAERGLNYDKSSGGEVITMSSDSDKQQYAFNPQVSTDTLDSSRANNSSPEMPVYNSYSETNYSSGANNSQNSANMQGDADFNSTKVNYAANNTNHIPHELGDFQPFKQQWRQEELEASARFKNYPLGAACAALHETYIVSQTDDAIFITDQHAAHERLVYEEIKAKLSSEGIARQRLLIPEVVEFSNEKELQAITTHSKQLEELGLVIEPFGKGSVITREIPSLLGEIDVAGLVKDVASHLEDVGEDIALTEMIKHVTETYACHHSIRSGRRMNLEEMNGLLREMENTAHSGQCNHGRPTYVELKLKDIEKLFGRR